MTRNTAREIAMHLAFELSFTDLPIGEFLDQYLSEEKFAELAPECDVYAQRPNAKQETYIRRLVSGVAEHAAELDAYIEKYAKGWRFERISLVASAIMRLAMYEIMYMPDIPHGVAINEAVELTRKYDEPETATFDRETAMQWAANMQNADGTTGPHWTMEQTTAVAESMGIQAPVVPRWAWGVTMNMMYSDYYPVAVEFGLNRTEFYAALAKAFLLDKDGPGPEQKLMAYYEHIARS